MELESSSRGKRNIAIGVATSLALTGALIGTSLLSGKDKNTAASSNLTTNPDGSIYDMGRCYKQGTMDIPAGTELCDYNIRGPGLYKIGTPILVRELLSVIHLSDTERKVCYDTLPEDPKPLQLCPDVPFVTENPLNPDKVSPQETFEAYKA